MPSLVSRRVTGVSSDAKNSSGGSRKLILRAVVHRHDESRPELMYDRHRGRAADRRPAAHRQEEHIDVAERRSLLGS